MTPQDPETLKEEAREALGIPLRDISDAIIESLFRHGTMRGHADDDRIGLLRSSDDESEQIGDLPANVDDVGVRSGQERDLRADDLSHPRAGSDGTGLRSMLFDSLSR